MTDYALVDPDAYERRQLDIPRERYLRAHWTHRVEAAIAEHCRGPRVLDLGCGYGRYTRVIPAPCVVGLDMTQRWLDHGHRHGVENAVRGDAHRLPFADDTFDALVSVGLMEYVDRPRVLAEISRVLKPGGPAVLLVPNRYGAFRATARMLCRIARRPYFCSEPSSAEMMRLFRGAGLDVLAREMNDGLIWLPDAVDRGIGAVAYPAVERLFGPLGRNPFSNIMLFVVRRRSR